MEFLNIQHQKWLPIEKMLNLTNVNVKIFFVPMTLLNNVQKVVFWKYQTFSVTQNPEIMTHIFETI